MMVLLLLSMSEMKLLMMLMVAAVRNKGPEPVDPEAQLRPTLQARLVNADGSGGKSERKTRQDLMPVGSSEMTMFRRKGRLERLEGGKFWRALCELHPQGYNRSQLQYYHRP